MQPDYQFYATLLDSFAWYKRNEKEGANTGAHMQGYNAADKGAKKEDNPHKPGTLNHGLWNKGHSEYRSATNEETMEEAIDLQALLAEPSAIHDFIRASLAEKSYTAVQALKPEVGKGLAERFKDEDDHAEHAEKKQKTKYDWKQKKGLK